MAALEFTGLKKGRGLKRLLFKSSVRSSAGVWTRSSVLTSDLLNVLVSFRPRTHRLQDETSGGIQEEPGGAGRAGAQTRKGTDPVGSGSELLNPQQHSEP